MRTWEQETTVSQSGQSENRVSQREKQQTIQHCKSPRIYLLTPQESPTLYPLENYSSIQTVGAQPLLVRQVPICKNAICCVFTVEIIPLLGFTFRIIEQTKLKGSNGVTAWVLFC